MGCHPADVARALSRYALKLLQESNSKFFLVVQSEDGERFWMADECLRKEFIVSGKLEHRSWGMREVSADGVVDHGSAPADVSRGGVDDTIVSDLDVRSNGCGSTVGHVKVDVEVRDRSKDRRDDGDRERASSTTRCHYCKMVGHYRRECPNVVCYRCGQRGHRSIECERRFERNGSADRDRKEEPRSSRAVTCVRCHREGHFMSECPGGVSKEDLEQIRHANLRCLGCKVLGHVIRDCPNKEALVAAGGAVPAPVKCRKCSEFGHFKKDCPNRPYCESCRVHGHDASYCGGNLRSDSGSGGIRSVLSDSLFRYLEREIDVPNALEALKEGKYLTFAWNQTDKSYWVNVRREGADDELTKVRCVRDLREVFGGRSNRR